MLELRAVSRRFSGIVAVDEVTFTARSGEVTGYLGPNGSGKLAWVRAGRAVFVFAPDGPQPPINAFRGGPPV